MNPTSLKDAAIDFLRLVAAGDVDRAYAQYVGPGFRHHNPYFRGDALSLKVAMEESAVQSPDKILEVKRAIEGGDLVATHSWIRQNRDDRGAAVVHIFRFEAGRIVEAWDVGQDVPTHSPNEHGMF